MYLQIGTTWHIFQFEISFFVMRALFRIFQIKIQVSLHLINSTYCSISTTSFNISWDYISHFLCCILWYVVVNQGIILLTGKTYIKKKKKYNFILPLQMQAQFVSSYRSLKLYSVRTSWKCLFLFVDCQKTLEWSSLIQTSKM